MKSMVKRKVEISLTAHIEMVQQLILDPSTEEFKRDILFATSMKLQTMPERLKIRLTYSRLPLIHAYVQNGKYSFQNSMDYIIAHINRLRIQGTLK